MKSSRYRMIFCFGCMFLCITLVFLLVFLDKHIDMLTDAADASEMILAYNLAEKGEWLLSKDWYYSTELRVLNTQLFRIPFFYMTDNWHNVRMLGNALIYIFLIGCILLFSKVNNITIWFPLLCGILFIPFSYDHFSFILSRIYYIPYIAISLIMLVLTIEFGRPDLNKRLKGFIFLIGMILSFFAGLGGLRQLFVYYFPLFIAVFLYCWMKHTIRNCAKGYIYYTFLTGIAAVFGYYINSHFLRSIYPYENRELIHYTRIWAETVFKIINGWLMNFGYRQGGSIFSFATIANALSGFIVLLAVYSVYLIIRNKESYTDGNLLTTLFFCAGMLFFLLFYSSTDAMYETRYCYPISIFMIPIIFIGIGNSTLEYWDNIKKGIVIGLLVFLVTICGVDYYKNMAKQASKSKNAELSIISEHLVKGGYENGYATFWNGNILTELSNGSINVWVLGTAYEDQDVEDLSDIFRWLQYKSHVTVHPNGKTFVLLGMKEDQNFTLAKLLPENAAIYKSDNYIIYGFETFDELYSLVITKT